MMKKILLFFIVMLNVGIAIGQKDTVIYFNFDKYQITPSNESILMNFISSSKSDTLYIDGYTDCVGTNAYNQQLSEKRANQVKKVLEAFDNKKQYIVSAHGEKYANIEQKAEDRKVTVTIKTDNVFNYDSIYGIVLAKNTVEWLNNEGITLDSILIIKEEANVTNTRFSHYYYYFPIIDKPENLSIHLKFSNSFSLELQLFDLKQMSRTFYSLDVTDIIRSEDYKKFINS